MTPRFWISAIVAATFTHASVAATQWTAASGGNDHYYDAVLVQSGIDWNTAKVGAIASGGYLATITSAAENSFVFALLGGNANFWINDNAGNKQGPWLGAFQPAGSVEPGGGWTWVTGEAFSFTAWGTGEPNNSGGVEDSLQYFGFGASIPVAPRWNDARGTNNAIHGYLVEFNSAPVPEPETGVLLAAGLLLTGLAARRRRTSDRP